jgi:hypothetical protein
MQQDHLGGLFFLEKQSSVCLGYDNPAIRFETLARASPSDFMLLSGLFNQSLEVLGHKTCEA